ncbi:serine hydrolase domain-containing protein [Rhodococcus gannanensis]|uniref:Serine hydrolase domain-containing protein n=1 Tax=Rhodococcus gannanensis TaxID=1960308 RepID=A0ABW4P5N3_9NOCA
MRRSLGTAVLALTVAVTPACSTGDETTPAPEATIAGNGGIGDDGSGDWTAVPPDEAGLDPAVLDAMAAEAAAHDSYCLLVARNGRIAGEWYWNDVSEHTGREVFSVTKSATSLLAGIAADDGAVELDAPAAEWIPQWQGTDSATVTVSDLLGNDSGRYWSMSSDYGELIRAQDRSAYAVGLAQQDPPGTVWAYNNAAIQTLVPLLESASGTPFVEFGRDRLLAPLGMTDSAFGTDASGGGVSFMGLRSTCRDLGRLGELVLQDGVWDGRRIVSEEYLDAATGRASQDLNAAYGYLFWRNAVGPIAGAVSPLSAQQVAGRADAQMAPGRPEDLVWALGLGGQIVQIHAPTNTVVVRIGPPEPGADYDYSATAKVLDAIRN